jgi:glycosyltransferase involved in cell wall biosynthesis
MRGECVVSVNICTYNRCDLLKVSLESLLCQEADGLRYEVVVVDNNSTDGTRHLVESFVRRGHTNVRYFFEQRQGLSFARNTGIQAARAPILAFTDDDVRVAPNWIATIKRSLDEHPEVDCIGGRVLPWWTCAPPAWLTRDHWAPLAIVDYGDRPFYVNAKTPLCLLTANMAMRREALIDIGCFQPKLQRVQDSVGSMEDHELLIRLWKSNRQGLYVPELLVTSEIVAGRLRKRYHRRWHRGHGRFHAMARLEETERSNSGRLFDVAAHMYRQAALDAVDCLANLARGRRARAFANETDLLFFAGFFQERYAEFRRGADPGRLREVVRFLRSITRLRLRRLQARASIAGGPSRSPRP